MFAGPIYKGNGGNQANLIPSVPNGSDLDILIDPTPETTLMDVARIQVELQRLLGVSVDVLTPRALPDAFRNHVLAEAMPV